MRTSKGRLYVAATGLSKWFLQRFFTTDMPAIHVFGMVRALSPATLAIAKVTRQYIAGEGAARRVAPFEEGMWMLLWYILPEVIIFLPERLVRILFCHLPSLTSSGRSVQCFVYHLPLGSGSGSKRKCQNNKLRWSIEMTVAYLMLTNIWWNEFHEPLRPTPPDWATDSRLKSKLLLQSFVNSILMFLAHDLILWPTVVALSLTVPIYAGQARMASCMC